MPPTIRVVLIADAQYVIPLAAAVRSILDNARDGSQVDITVLSCAIPAADRRRLTSSWRGGPVRFVEFDCRQLAALPTSSAVISHPTICTYARLLLPDLLSASWDKVIYLDADTITLTTLDDLWSLRLGDHLLAAAEDCDVDRLSSPWGVQCWRELDLDPDAPYFNAGLMVINLKAWRREQIGKHALRYVEEHRDRVLLFDQEGLNAVVGGRFLPLAPEWNVMQPARRIQDPEIFQRVRIWHFTGPRKPWITRHYERTRAEAFFRYLDRTDWSGWRPHPEK